MKNKYIPIIFLAIFVASYYGGQMLRSQKKDPAELELQKMDYALCDPSLSACVVNYLNQNLEFRFKQKPSALKSFTVQVETSDIHISEILVDFRMKNMDMGVNVIRLKNSGSNNWSGEAILPVCSLGRIDWVTQLQVKSKNTLWYADFLFQQNNK